MKIIRGSRNIRQKIKNPVMTLGNFDGVHIGHKTIFEEVVRKAREINGTSIVYTFEPHPLKVVSPHKCPPMLTSFHKKMEFISHTGIDMVICADFTRQFSDQRPREFAEKILHKSISAKYVYVGYDYKFGRGKEGTIDYLKKMGSEFDFSVTVIDPVSVNDLLVSSTKIREMVETGLVLEARTMLGRFYSLKGKVVTGFKKGTVIGFPTANIDLLHELIPHTGVYAVYVSVDNGEKLKGVANVGYNPTFNRDILNVEAHIFDFNEDIYNKEVEVFFVKRIRDEVSFNSTDDLVKQIKDDISKVNDFLEIYNEE